MKKMLIEVEFKDIKPHNFTEGVLNSALIARGFGIAKVKFMDGVDLPDGDIVHETNELKKTLKGKEKELKTLSGQLKTREASLVAREKALEKIIKENKA